LLFVYDSHAVIADQTMYIYGCIGLDPTTANLVPGGIEPEAEQVCILSFLALLTFNPNILSRSYCSSVCV